MKILVVGARGFIGAALAAELSERGEDVTCVTRGTLPMPSEGGARWARIDHLSQQSWDEIIAQQFDVIYHLGWSTIPRTAANDPVADLTENVGAGLRLLIAVKNHAPKSRVIFASSGGTVYGRATAALLAETHAPKPISAYGAGKLAYEQYLLMFRAEHGIDATCARISNAYGPNQFTNLAFGAVSTFTRMAVHGETIKIFGSGDITRDYIYVTDITASLIRLGTVETLPECLNISSGIGTSLFDIIRDIEDLLGRKIDYEIIDSRSFDLSHIVLDNSALKRTIDWAPRISLRDGIRNIINSLMDGTPLAPGGVWQSPDAHRQPGNAKLGAKPN